MRYQKGDRVRHPAKEDWGLGEVLEDSSGGTVRVFFVGAGEKVLSLDFVKPEKVAPEEAAHPVLDNLKITKTASGIKYQSLPESIAYFLQEYPEGFYGEKFGSEERDYKVRAHELAEELLNEADLGQLIESGDYAEISRRALRVMNATNLVFPNEKMALKDGLEDPDAQKAFGIALRDLLHGEEDLEKRVKRIAKVLENIGAAKWTVLTYFPFIAKPDEFMFVKPTITQHAAELCGFEINYRPQLNWMTFKQVMEFSRYLKDELEELKPRDMIDVQSFMWCIAPKQQSGQSG